MKILSKTNLLLCLLCAGLSYHLYHEMSRAPDQVPRIAGDAGQAMPVATPKQSLQLPPMPPRQQFSQLIARPPFAATRRPLQPRRVVVEAKPQAIPKPKILLVGTFVNSESGVAVVQKAGVEKQIRLSKGETIDGWKLEKILPDRILLKSKDEAFEVKLREPGSSRR